MVENEQEMARHVNMMNKSSSPKLSTLNIKGSSTDPGKETGKALLEAHYLRKGQSMTVTKAFIPIC